MNIILIILGFVFSFIGFKLMSDNKDFVKTLMGSASIIFGAYLILLGLRGI